MGKARWIKLYSGIRDSAVWSDPLRLKAWIDILLSANYKDKEWFKNGQVVKIRRGQYVTSIRKLADTWKCSPNTARRILDQFVELHMIERNSGTGKYTLITVVKYGDFQDCNLPDGYTDGYTDEHTDGYTDEHTDGYTDGIQHKNNKNTKKDIENKEPDAPLGAPDQGPIPDGWTDEDEREFQKDYENNLRMHPEGYVRQDYYDFWHG